MLMDHHVNDLGIRANGFGCDRDDFVDELTFPGVREARGNVRLKSADMRDAPLIDPRFLSEVPSDCPAALRQVLLTCLSPDREHRYGSEQQRADDKF